jgi:hypothetical protein
VPDIGLRQLKTAVRPLFQPRIESVELITFFVGWLVVAQAVFHLTRRQRAVDAFLLAIAIVLVGRTVTAGNTLVAAELAAIALLLPVLVLLSRLEDGMRSTLVAVLLGTWLAASSVRLLFAGSASVATSLPELREVLLRNVPPPPMLAHKAFSYVSLAWLLTVAGVLPHVAAGMTVLFVILLVMLQFGVPQPAYGWVDLVLAVLAGWVVARWMPKGVSRS